MAPGSAVGDFVKHVHSMVELLDRAQQRDELAYRILDTASLATAADRAAARSLGVLKRRGWTRRDERIWAWHSDPEGALPRGRVLLVLRRHEDALGPLFLKAHAEVETAGLVQTYGPLLQQLHDAARGFYAAARALAEERHAALPGPERRTRDAALGRVYAAIGAVPPRATPIPPVRRGRKRADAAAVRADSELAAEWAEAREAGIYKPEFVREREGMTVRKLDLALNRHSKRKSRKPKPESIRNNSSRLIPREKLPTAFPGETGPEA